MHGKTMLTLQRDSLARAWPLPLPHPDLESVWTLSDEHCVGQLKTKRSKQKVHDRKVNSRMYFFVVFGETAGGLAWFWLGLALAWLRLGCWLAGWVRGPWLADGWLAGWVRGWLAGRLAGCMRSSWLAGWVRSAWLAAGWLAGWLVGYVAGAATTSATNTATTTTTTATSAIAAATMTTTTTATAAATTATATNATTTAGATTTDDPRAAGPAGGLPGLAWLAGFVAGRLGFVMDLLCAASALLCFKMYRNPYNLPRLRRGLLLMYFTLNHAGV